ncbi:hypothetical protein J6590_091821, partial [Homalodisca vitripennis]
MAKTRECQRFLKNSTVGVYAITIKHPRYSRRVRLREGVTFCLDPVRGDISDMSGGMKGWRGLYQPLQSKQAGEITP